MRRAIVLSTIVVAFGLGCLALAPSARASAVPFYRTREMSPEWLSIRAANAPDMHRVAAFRLTDQNGRTVTQKAFAGKVTIVQFFFTGCGDICPNTTSNIAALMASLPTTAPVQVLSHSVTPDRDSTAALQRFAKERGVVDPRWHLLTGPVAEINGLARDSYFVRIGDGRTYNVASIAHTESVLLVDSEGRIRGVYAGTLKLEMDRMVEDIRTLLAEGAKTAQSPAEPAPGA